jgi:hypothetical protein
MTRRPRKEGTPVTSRPAATQHLRDLARRRRVRDRIDPESAQPLEVEALARGAQLSAGHLQQPLHRTGRDAAQHPPAPGRTGDGGDALMGGQTGDQTDQESRSAGPQPQLA